MSQHLPVVSGNQAVRAFSKVGFVLVPKRGKGSHYFMNHPDKPVVLTIPDHDPLRRGTLRSLIRDAGLTVQEFRNLI